MNKLNKFSFSAFTDNAHANSDSLLTSNNPYCANQTISAKLLSTPLESSPLNISSPLKSVLPISKLLPRSISNSLIDSQQSIESKATIYYINSLSNNISYELLKYIISSSPIFENIRYKYYNQ